MPSYASAATPAPVLAPGTVPTNFPSAMIEVRRLELELNALKLENKRLAALVELYQPVAAPIIDNVVVVSTIHALYYAASFPKAPKGEASIFKQPSPTNLAQYRAQYEGKLDSGETLAQIAQRLVHGGQVLPPSPPQGSGGFMGKVMQSYPNLVRIVQAHVGSSFIYYNTPTHEWLATNNRPIKEKRNKASHKVSLSQMCGHLNALPATGESTDMLRTCFRIISGHSVHNFFKDAPTQLQSALFSNYGSDPDGLAVRARQEDEVGDCSREGQVDCEEEEDEGTQRFLKALQVSDWKIAVPDQDPNNPLRVVDLYN